MENNIQIEEDMQHTIEYGIDGLEARMAQLNLDRGIPHRTSEINPAGMPPLNKTELENIHDSLYEHIIKDNDKNKKVEHYWDKELIKQYVERYPEFVRPLIEKWLIFRGTKSETIHRKIHDSIDTTRKEWVSLRNELKTQIYLNDQQKFMLYFKTIYLKRQAQTYDVYLKGTDLQIKDLDRAIAAKSDGQDISKIVDPELFPEKCYQMDVSDLETYKQRLQANYNLAEIYKKRLDFNLVVTGEKYEMLDSHLHRLNEEFRRVSYYLDELITLELDTMKPDVWHGESVEEMYLTRILNARGRKEMPEKRNICGLAMRYLDVLKDINPILENLVITQDSPAGKNKTNQGGN